MESKNHEKTSCLLYLFWYNVFPEIAKDSICQKGCNELGISYEYLRSYQQITQPFKTNKYFSKIKYSTYSNSILLNLRLLMIWFTFFIRWMELSTNGQSYNCTDIRNSDSFLCKVVFDFMLRNNFNIWCEKWLNRILNQEKKLLEKSKKYFPMSR